MRRVSPAVQAFVPSAIERHDSKSSTPACHTHIGAQTRPSTLRRTFLFDKRRTMQHTFERISLRAHENEMLERVRTAVVVVRLGCEREKAVHERRLTSSDRARQTAELAAILFKRDAISLKRTNQLKIVHLVFLCESERANFNRVRRATTSHSRLAIGWRGASH